MAATLYTTHAISTLSFVAQLLPPPPHVVQHERHVLSHLLHRPPNSFGVADYFHLQDWGSARLPSIIVLSASSLLRAATHTIAWKDALAMLQGIASDTLSIAALGRGDNKAARRAAVVVVALGVCAALGMASLLSAVATSRRAARGIHVRRGGAGAGALATAAARAIRCGGRLAGAQISTPRDGAYRRRPLSVRYISSCAGPSL